MTLTLILAVIAALAVGMAIGALLSAWRVDLDSPGAHLVARERRRQKRKGYTPDADRVGVAQFGLGHLGASGAAFALRAVGSLEMANKVYPLGDRMPEPVNRDGLPAPIVDLVKAGAFIVAEIDLQESLAKDFVAKREAGEAMAAKMHADQTTQPKNEGVPHATD